MGEETNFYEADEFNEAFAHQILSEVAEILEERGYNPINQITGYLMSGDPGYISSYKEARNKILQIDRSTLLELLVKNYLQ